jgi:hypothetical protein
MTPRSYLIAAVLAAAYLTIGRPAGVSATPDSSPAKMAELWEAPSELSSRDLFNGPWGAERAPDPEATYVFVEPKKGGFVEFAYEGRHQELFDRTITPDDVRWASALMAGLGRDQWRDAFRAGAYDAAVSNRFINRLIAKIGDGLALSRAETR